MKRAGLKRSPSEWLPYAGSAALICLLIVMLTGVAIWQESLRYRERAEVFAQNASIMLAEHINDVFEKGDTLLQQIAFHYRDRRLHGEFDPQRFQEYLTSELQWSKDFRDIRMLDAEGVLRFGTGVIEPINLADRDYFVRPRDQQPSPGVSPMIFSGPIFTRLSKKWVLVLARRLENPDGSFAGVVYANLNIDDFTKLFSSINTGAHGTIVLRAEDMAQVSRHPTMDGPDAGNGNQKVSQQLIDLIKESPLGGSYHATSPLDDIERYYTYRKINDYPFYIIAGQATNDFLANWGPNVFLLLVSSGLMMLLTIATSWRIYGLTQQRVRETVDRNAGKIIEASPVAMLMFNEHGIVTKANPAARALFGYRQDESLTGVPVDQLQPVETLDTQAHRVAGGLEEGSITTEGLYDRKDGSQFTALRSVSALTDEVGDGAKYLETLVDITELKAAQEELRRLAHYDALTNLPNRSLFFDLVDQGLALARREKSQTAILFLDLDKFKPINDTWGHAVGDLVLKEAAQRIAACLRESDAVGRVGGDEFLVMLRNLQSVEDAVRIGDKIRNSLNQPILVDDKTVSISSCIGVALYPDHGLTAEALTEHADTAMYHAKENGRDRVVVYRPDFEPATQ